MIACGPVANFVTVNIRNDVISFNIHQSLKNYVNLKSHVRGYFPLDPTKYNLYFDKYQKNEKHSLLSLDCR